MNPREDILEPRIYSFIHLVYFNKRFVLISILCKSWTRKGPESASFHIIFLCAQRLGWWRLVITSKVLRSQPRLGWPVWNICVTNDHIYVPLVWTPTSFLVYINNIYGLHLKGQRQLLSQNWDWLKFIHTILYQNALWHGNDCLIVHIC
jgi:hypothetical protein